MNNVAKHIYFPAAKFHGRLHQNIVRWNFRCIVEALLESKRINRQRQNSIQWLTQRRIHYGSSLNNNSHLCPHFNSFYSYRDQFPWKVSRRWPSAEPKFFACIRKCLVGKRAATIWKISWLYSSVLICRQSQHRHQHMNFICEYSRVCLHFGHKMITSGRRTTTDTTLSFRKYAAAPMKMWTGSRTGKVSHHSSIGHLLPDKFFNSFFVVRVKIQIFISHLDFICEVQLRWSTVWQTVVRRVLKTEKYVCVDDASYLQLRIQEA